MAEKVCLPADTTCWEQVDSRKQFDNQTISQRVLGYNVPICYKRPGLNSQAIVMYGPKYHDCIQYMDTIYKHCCMAVWKFNINHYYKCYLTNKAGVGKDGQVSVPYEVNKCHYCDVSIQDDCGNTMSFSVTKKIVNSNLYWKGCKALQDCDNCDVLESGSFNRYNNMQKEVL